MQVNYFLNIINIDDFLLKKKIRFLFHIYTQKGKIVLKQTHLESRWW